MMMFKTVTSDRNNFRISRMYVGWSLHIGFDEQGRVVSKHQWG